MQQIIIAFCGFLFTLISLHFALPLLQKRSVAIVNERSAHTGIIPQGGGFFVFLGLMLCALLANNYGLWLALLAFSLSIIGLLDDSIGLSIKWRITAQALIASFALWFLTPAYPLWFLPVLWIGLIWNINLTNFMDGMDWISVTQTLSIGFGIIIAGYFGLSPQWTIWFSILLIATMLGFAPLNSPKARLFLGDSGSLPLGLITGVLLIAYGEKSGIIPALILTLYYITDSGITLILRFFRGEKLWEGHKSHFYQQAMQKGMNVKTILTKIAVINVMLILISIIAASLSMIGQAFAFALAQLIVFGLIWNFKKAPL